MYIVLVFNETIVALNILQETVVMEGINRTVMALNTYIHINGIIAKHIIHKMYLQRNSSGNEYMHVQGKKRRVAVLNVFIKHCCKITKYSIV